MLVAFVLGCFCIGLAYAEPEPTPKQTKGTIIGEIVKKHGSKIAVKGKEGELTLMPYWHGGMPQDGGGLDKEMVQRLEQFKVGDKVKVTWTFQEHYRIDTIEPVK